MTLNKQSGNMYPWCTHTWNPIKGKCPHECVYCYMNRFPQGELRLDEKCLQDQLGKGNTIFVGSSTDMWAEEVPDRWIELVLNKCRNSKNTFLFQTKNPRRFKDFNLPSNAIYGVTLETTFVTLSEKISKAPNVRTRFFGLRNLPAEHRKMVSIEPVLEFDLAVMIRWLSEIEPEFVSIGADSKGHNLEEPGGRKIHQLVQEIKKFTAIKVKDNLRRIEQFTGG